MERRFLSAATVRLESRVGTDFPYIVGTAAPFYNAADPGTEYELWNYGDERCVERIMPTAFDEVLKAGCRDCMGLFNHNPDNVLGRVGAGTMTLSKTARGLQYSITPPDSPLAKGVIQSLTARGLGDGLGDVKGSSFSFTVDKSGQRWIEQGGLVIREIHSVSGLFDCGPVTFPAYGASSSSMRAAGDDDSAKKAFEAHRAEHRAALFPQLAAYRARAVELGG